MIKCRKVYQFLSLIINITIIIAANILKFMMQEINSNHSRKKLWQGVRITLAYWILIFQMDFFL
jgi:hypothetical protein